LTSGDLAVLSPQKGAGYHLDLFLVAVLMVLCSFLGLPWYVAATVISIAHLDSLKMETQTSAPGEQPRFLGVRRVDLAWLFHRTIMLGSRVKTCLSGKVRGQRPEAEVYVQNEALREGEREATAPPGDSKPQHT